RLRLDAADRSVAPSNEAFDAGLQRQAFPPDVASLLPGSLATTWAGLAPAGGDELTGYALSDHPAHLHPVFLSVPSGHAVIAPAGHVPVEQFDPVLQGEGRGSRVQFPHSLLHPLQRLGGDPDTDLAIATMESEAQDGGLRTLLERPQDPRPVSVQPPQLGRGHSIHSRRSLVPLDSLHRPRQVLPAEHLLPELLLAVGLSLPSGRRRTAATLCRWFPGLHRFPPRQSLVRGGAAPAPAVFACFLGSAHLMFCPSRLASPAGSTASADSCSVSQSLAALAVEAPRGTVDSGQVSPRK